MKFPRLLVTGVFLFLIIIGVSLWWTQPHTVDMSEYVPADSVAYLEINSVTAVASAIEETDTWKAMASSLGFPLNSTKDWRSSLVRIGVGPAAAVVFSRAQIALVVVGMNQTQVGDTLRIKPEMALVAETQTSRWRLRPLVAEAVERLANFAYGQSTCSRRGDDPDYLECTPTSGDRKIIAAIDDSVVVVGNSEKAVDACLSVRRGSRPSLRTDGEMVRVRSSLGATKSLGFGYISAGNAAHLFSWAAPLIMGKREDESLKRMLETSADKVLRGIAWTSTPSMGGIEDRLVVTLDPTVASRLEPAFAVKPFDDTFWKFIPAGFQSVTIYSNRDPVAAWEALDSALALKLDAMSAVLFSSLLKSSLAVYGIGDPKELLGSLTPPVMTVRPTSDGPGSVLLARITDRQQLRKTLINSVFKGVDGQIVEGMSAEPNTDKEFTAVILDDYLILGKTESVQPYLGALKLNSAINSPMEKVRHFAPKSTSAIVTYADDEQRIENFISVIALLRKAPVSAERMQEFQSAPGYWKFSATETSLVSSSIERKSRSAFGQFSTLLSLLKQDSSPANR